MKKGVRLLAVLTLSASVVLAQNKPKAEDVQTFTLKNGMKFMVLEDHSIPNANSIRSGKLVRATKYTVLPACRTFLST